MSENPGYPEKDCQREKPLRRMAVSYYSVSHIEGGMAQVREMFSEPVDFALNWLFVGTSGVHGHGGHLDQWGIREDDGENGILENKSLTVLLVQPRTVRIQWSTIDVPTVEDALFLKHCVEQTILAVAALGAPAVSVYRRSLEHNLTRDPV